MMTSHGTNREFPWYSAKLTFCIHSTLKIPLKWTFGVQPTIKLDHFLQIFTCDVILPQKWPYFYHFQLWHILKFWTALMILYVDMGVPQLLHCDKRSLGEILDKKIGDVTSGFKFWITREIFNRKWRSFGAPILT